MNEDFCSQEVWEPQSEKKVKFNTFIKILIKSNIEEAFLTIEMDNTSSNNKVNNHNDSVTDSYHHKVQLTC